MSNELPAHVAAFLLTQAGIGPHNTPEWEIGDQYAITRAEVFCTHIEIVNWGVMHVLHAEITPRGGLDPADGSHEP
jgi:hypothetical protein